MKRLKKLLVSFVAICLIACQCLTTFADGGSNIGDGGIALASLITKISKPSGSEGKGWNYTNKTYKCSDGGYKMYEDLAKDDEAQPISEANLNTLTTGAKNDFLEDYFNAGMMVINDDPQDAITEEVGTNWLELVQNTEGVGSQLMTTLMAQTKPDYVTANRIYQPFSGPVGVILGICAILIMAFLAITMVLDLAYIAIPTFQLFVDGDGQGGGGQGGGKKKSFISQEAIDAVQMAVGGQGGGGQNGSSNKLAVSIYFKKRVLMLVVLGICLLYLVSGNIFALVGWVIDLLSGFLGF